jgi:hypothetical protein
MDINKQYWRLANEGYLAVENLPGHCPCFIVISLEDILSVWNLEFA